MTVPFDILPSEEGFLGLPEEEAFDYASAKAIIIPFGLEGSVSYGGGTAKGPSAMIEASHQVEGAVPGFRYRDDAGEAC